MFIILDSSGLIMFHCFDLLYRSKYFSIWPKKIYIEKRKENEMSQATRGKSVFTKLPWLMTLRCEVLL